MKILFTFLLCLISFNLLAMPNLFPGPDGIRFSKDYSEKIEKRIHDQLLTADKANEVELTGLQNILKTGKRAVQWFEKVNSERPPDKQLDLSQKGASKGMPLEAPMKTNSTILIDRFDKIVSNTPPLVLSILFSEDDLPLSAPLSDEEFVALIRLYDVVYQHTIRWSGSKDYLSWYINRSLWDIRGYVFLKNETELEVKLARWSELAESEKNNLSSWLYGLCHNGDFEDSDCKLELQSAITKGRLFSYYQRFNRYGEGMYKSFFKIPAIRPEVYWDEFKTKLYSPFLSPSRIDVKNWLSDNIQDEWKSIGFNLLLDFKETSPTSIPHIDFLSGVTAHVNEIAGDTITMDGDYSINSYAQRWTIRHEYGHVLGFVDCYLEFYDVSEKAMIYYEIDTDNLMCSRHGNLKAEHITELKSAYK